MKSIILLTVITGLVLSTGCHAHGANKVVVHKVHSNNKVILVDNGHKRQNYRIVHVRPKNISVCKKHKKHWHCA